jgi:HK97 family phage major capsid protein
MSNRLEVISNNLEALNQIHAEIDALENKPTLSFKEEQRRVSLLSKAATLRSGVSALELNRATLYQMRKELGMTQGDMWAHRIKDERTVAEYHAMLADAREFQRSIARKEIRANEAGTQTLTYTEGPAGGYFVPFGYDTRQDVLMSKFALDQIVDPAFCTEFPTGNGNPMSTPVVDDIVETGTSPVTFTVGAARVVAENTADTEQDIKTNAVPWSETPTWRSGVLLITWEMFHDAQYGVEGVAGLIEAVVARRNAIGLGQAMITGQNVSGGLTSNLPAGQVSTSAASALAIDNFIDLYGSLAAPYRMNAAWFMHSNTQIALYKLLQTTGRSATELPTQFMGRPIAVCNSMNAQGAGVPNVVVLADVNYLQKRKAGTPNLQKYVERYAEYGVVGFQGFYRADFNTALWGSQVPPVVALSQHS